VSDFDYSTNRGYRLLNIHERLNKGELLNKTQLAQQFCVTEKTIQRDFDELRAYLAETHYGDSEASIRYDKSKNGYYLVRLDREWMTNDEVLAISKILLESRALCGEEMESLLDKLLIQAAPSDRAIVEGIIRNERFLYVPPRHGKKLKSVLWDISRLITGNEIMRMAYTRQDGVTREHDVKPVAILFSEYYFYLIAFFSDDRKDYPTVFRVDRIESFAGTGERFSVPYKDRFNDGEFRKRVQFMYCGELTRVEFEYSGPAIESVLDRLPTAEIMSECDGVYRVRTEVYGKGIMMWLRSQGDFVKVLSGIDEQ